MLSRRAGGGLALALAAALLIAAPVSAGSAGRTTISVDNNFSTGDAPFTTTGGVLCPAGTSTTDSILITNRTGNGRAFTFHGVKTFTCDDGSGSFRIRFDAATTAGSPQDQGGWSVIDGTGRYATISGGGNLVGTYDDEGIDDVYTGFVQP
jgi:hypothetical protein